MFALVVVGGVIDLILDAPEDLWTGHVLFETFMILASLAAASYLARQWYAASERLARSEASLEARRAERDAWRDMSPRSWT